MTITKDEILDAIRKAQEAQFVRPPHTYTLHELSEILEMGLDGTKAHVARMMKFGLCEKVTVKKLTTDGRVVNAIAYHLLFVV